MNTAKTIHYFCNILVIFVNCRGFSCTSWQREMQVCQREIQTYQWTRSGTGQDIARWGERNREAERQAGFHCPQADTKQRRSRKGKFMDARLYKQKFYKTFLFKKPNFHMYMGKLNINLSIFLLLFYSETCSKHDTGTMSKHAGSNSHQNASFI